MAERKREVLVEEVLEELAHAYVRPAAVDEQKALEVAELRQRVVARHHRLHALLTADANTDVSRYSHTHARTHLSIGLIQRPLPDLVSLSI